MHTIGYHIGTCNVSCITISSSVHIIEFHYSTHLHILGVTCNEKPKNPKTQKVKLFFWSSPNGCHTLGRLPKPETSPELFGVSGVTETGRSHSYQQIHEYRARKEWQLLLHLGRSHQLELYTYVPLLWPAFPIFCMSFRDGLV